MVSQRKSALQRIQVGGIGLIGVLIFVTLANFVVDRSFLSDDEASNLQVTGEATAPAQSAEEPLAEIGVAPTVEAKQSRQQNTAPPLPKSRNSAPPVSDAASPFQ